MISLRSAQACEAVLAGAVCMAEGMRRTDSQQPVLRRERALEQGRRRIRPEPPNGLERKGLEGKGLEQDERQRFSRALQ